MSVNIYNKSDQSLTPLASNIYSDIDYTEVKGELNNKANKSTTLAGYGITDAYTKTEVNTALNNKIDKTDIGSATLTIKQNGTEIGTFSANATENVTVDLVEDSNKGTWGFITGTLSDQTDLQTALDAKADDATTLAGYGITDAKIDSGKITLGSNSITPLTSASTLDATKISGTLPASTYTNTTYSNKSAASNGTDVSLVTTGEKYIWNNKASTDIATTSTNGLMSSTDKTKLDSIVDPMSFKGSLGTDGTITTLPTAAAANKGFTYKVITAGTYDNQSAKIGDTFISDGSSWILIPSGDEPNGTVTSVKVQGTNGLSGSGTITTSGTITLSNAGVRSITQDSSDGHKLTINTDGTSSTITIPDNNTTYSSKTAASGGTDVSLVTTGEKYTWNNKTSNIGTVTSVAVKMNNSTKGTVTTSGTIDLGTVITSHQDISGKANKATTLSGYGITDAYTKTEVGDLIKDTSNSWTGTSAEWEALDKSSVTDGTQINITDDYDTASVSVNKDDIMSLEAITASTEDEDTLNTKIASAQSVKDLNTKYITMQSNFQAGVNSVYNAVVAKGVTPSSKSLSDVVTAIGNISGGALKLTVYSAINDTIYYYDANGYKVSGSTGSDGVGSILIDEDLVGTSVTFYSSVAKDPSSTSSAYTKAVTITKAISVIHLHPDNVIFWYGYNPGSCSSVSGSSITSTVSASVSSGTSGSSGTGTVTVCTADTSKFTKQNVIYNSTSFVSTALTPSTNSNFYIVKTAGRVYSSDTFYETCSIAIGFDSNRWTTGTSNTSSFSTAWASLASQSVYVTVTIQAIYLS